MKIEPLDYVRASRTLIDQNGLAVARGVNPGDAARILSAFAACSAFIGEGAIAKVADLARAAAADEPPALKTGPLGDLLDLLHEMLEFEASQFNATCADCDGSGQAPKAEWTPGCIPKCPTCDGTGVDEDRDLSVSGADMVDAFTGWRARLKATLPLVMFNRGDAA